MAEAPDRSAGRLAGAVGLAALLVGLALLLEPASRRGPAALLLAAGLAVGVAAALRLPASGRTRSPMERLNDAAFLVVVAVVALIAVRLARPWTAALPGLVGGALIGLALRPRPAPIPGQVEAPPADPGASDPGHAGPSPGDSGAPESGG